MPLEPWPGLPPRADERAEHRFLTVLAVDVDGSRGWTQDVSATGVYFEASAPRSVGSTVHFLLELKISGERLKVLCEGEVVRVDHKAAGRVGVAARLRSSFLTSAAEGPVAWRSSDSVPAALDD